MEEPMARRERPLEAPISGPMRHRFWDEGDVEQEVRDLALRNARTSVEKFAHQLKNLRNRGQGHVKQEKNA